MFAVRPVSEKVALFVDAVVVNSAVTICSTLPALRPKNVLFGLVLAMSSS